MKPHVDKNADALYLRLDDSNIVESEEVSPGVVLDYNEADEVAGIEFLYLSKRSPNMDDVDVLDTQTKPLSLGPMQRAVLDALRSVENKEYRLGDWYLGALYALKNHNNPDRISQAAQSLRELMEKLPRIVRAGDVHIYTPNFQEMRREIFARLVDDKIRYEEAWREKAIDAKLEKTITKTYRYMELNQQPTRKEQIQIAIREIDPMADQMGVDIQNRKRDAFHSLWNQLERFSHHQINNDVDQQKFTVHLAALEQMVYDLLAPITAQDQDEIQTILNQPEHSEADAVTLYKLISRRGANYVYFFTHAADPYWIPHLKNKGFFRNPPSAEYSSDGYVHLPFWHEIQYLNRVCEAAPEEVLQLVQELPAVDNPRVYESILEIALKLEGVRSAKLKPKMLEYASLEHQFFPFQFPKLMAHWTANRQTKAALKLANLLVQFVPDPRAEEKQKQERQLNVDGISTDEDEFASMMTILRPLPRFNENYQEILDEGVRPLAEKEPYNVALLLIDATSNMIRLGMHQDELESGRSSDYSDIWCPRLKDPKREHPDPDESLVHTLTHACEKVYELEIESTEDLDNALRNERWEVFKRLRQHLYALHPNQQTRPWIRELILQHRDYGRSEHRYEFQRMIRLACEHIGQELLTVDERSQIFDAILNGPPEEDFRERMGDQFTKTEFERRKKRFHRRQLRPFAPVLFGKYLDDFKRLVADDDEDEITDASYPPDSQSKGGWVSTRSPVSSEELMNLSDGELLDYINEWQDEHWDTNDGATEINVGALAGAFQTVFKDSIIPCSERLNFWITNRDRIQRAIYVRMIVDAMRDDVAGRNFVRFVQWLEFCEWVLSHEDPQNEEADTFGRTGDESSESPNWRHSRRAVCDFVEACIKLDVDLPLSFRGQLGKLLEMLCTQYDWRLDNANPVHLNRDDQLAEAINTTRGSAVENLVKFGLWVLRHDDEADVPEVTAILEQRLGAESKYPFTLPEYAVLGMRFGCLFQLDAQWAVSRKSRLFPRHDMKSWRVAFGYFMRYNRPCSPIFDKLRGDFEFALDHLGSLGKQKGIGWELTVKLGQHLFTYYLWDVYPLNGDQSLLERYYLKTDGVRKHWATLFNYVGNSLRNTGEQLETGLKQRIVVFFESRLKVGDPMELREFATWLKAECLDAEWRLDALSEVLDVDGILDETGTLEEGRVEHPRTWLGYEVTGAMPTLLPKHTTRVVACFAKLTDALPTNGRFYIPTSDAKTILKSGLEHADESVREDARQARENLLRRGYFSVLD